MNAAVQLSERSPRLERLLSFLAQDPQNANLRADAAGLALDERQFELASELLDDVGTSSVLLNLKGVAALGTERFDQAAAAFEELRAGGEDNSAVRFNLAWAKAMLGDFTETEALLDDEAIAASPRGPTLKIEALHHLDRYDEGLEQGERLAELYPDDQALMGALATLAMDAGDAALARDYAERAGDTPEGLAARGMLMLEDGDPADALDLFDRAIDQKPMSARAWIGRGLGLLSQHRSNEAAEALEKGAQLFRDHLGSWIAAGWAYFTQQDYGKARSCFEHARDLDPNFAESHGGLAVLDIVEGDLESAARQCEIALRLDRMCLGGALAKSMLLEHEGKPAAAQRVRELALSSPIGPDGKTIGAALAHFTGIKRR